MNIKLANEKLVLINSILTKIEELPFTDEEKKMLFHAMAYISFRTTELLMITKKETEQK